MHIRKYPIFGALLAFLATDAAANSARDNFVSSRKKLPPSTHEEIGVPYGQPDREVDGHSTTRPSLSNEKNNQVGVPYDQPDREIDRNNTRDKTIYRRVKKKDDKESEPELADNYSLEDTSEEAKEDTISVKSVSIKAHPAK